MARLEAEGIAENTIVVLSSDNGGADYIGIDAINAPYRGWKNTFFEGGAGADVDLMAGQNSPGTRIDARVSHLDLMPTLVAAGGGTLPDDREIDGRDMAPLFAGAERLDRPTMTFLGHE